MPIPTINLDCAELEDDDLNALIEFLSSHTAVKTFSTSVMVNSDTPDVIEENSPVIMLIHLFVADWNKVTQGATGTDASILAGYWFAEELQNWCVSQGLIAEYDLENNVIPIQP